MRRVTASAKVSGASGTNPYARAARARVGVQWETARAPRTCPDKAAQCMRPEG